MSLAHARALLTTNHVHVEEFNPQRDEQRLRALASWAIRFSPIVAPDPPDGLLLDVSGCQRVHHGERRLVNAIGNSIEWLGFHARVACASTFACAWAVARFGALLNEGGPGASPGRPDACDRMIIAPGDELGSIRDLPIEALRLELDTIDALHEVNIDRIGHLTCLRRSELAARFGSMLLRRLDQALGDAEESLEPRRPSAPLRVERAFDGPVKQIEGILLTTQELVGELCDRLRTQERGVRRLDIECERIDASNLREAIMLSRPSRDAKHLWSLLHPKVEQINLGFGVEKIALTATRTERLAHTQTERWREQSSMNKAGIERAAGELIDTLASRLGADRIVRVKPVESHLPERAFKYESAMGERLAISDQSSAGIKQAERPTVLFDKPELIDVLAVTPEGPPKWLRWRGEEHTIIASAGPERIAEEWWRLAAELAPPGAMVSACAELARDYFRIQIDTGAWLWVYRQLDNGQWFVHGEWA